MVFTDSLAFALLCYFGVHFLLALVHEIYGPARLAVLLTRPGLWRTRLVAWLSRTWAFSRTPNATVVTEVIVTVTPAMAIFALCSAVGIEARMAMTLALYPSVVVLNSRPAADVKNLCGHVKYWGIACTLQCIIFDLAVLRQQEIALTFLTFSWLAVNVCYLAELALHYYHVSAIPPVMPPLRRSARLARK